MLLRVVPEALQHDLSLKTSTAQAHHKSAQGYAAWLMRNHQFSTWLRSDQSQILLVNAREASRLNPLSFFSAILLESLQELPWTLTIHYFCGVPDPNEAPNPLFLFRSLIFQLLSFRQYDLSFINTLDYHGIVCHSPSSLWSLFENLINSLHGTVLFCIIDGSLRYPGEDEVLSLIGALDDLTKRLHPSVRLKVLLTSPVSSEIMNIVPVEDRLIMPAENTVHGRKINARQMAFAHQRGPN